MYSANEIEKIIKKRLSKKRYTHSMNVAEEAKKLAKINGFDQEKAYLTGLLHDICKEIPQEEQLEMVKKSKRNVEECEYIVPQLYHSIAGSWYVENVLEIKDEDILNAIRYHTIGHANMTTLEKIIYLADVTSAERDYKDVETIREIVHKNLNDGMVAVMKFSIGDVVKKNSYLPIQTIQGYNQYIKGENTK